MHGWLELVIHGLQPFSVCENPSISKYIRYDATTVKTLKTYLGRLVERVESDVAKNILDSFLRKGFTSDTKFWKDTRMYI